MVSTFSYNFLLQVINLTSYTRLNTKHISNNSLNHKYFINHNSICTHKHHVNFCYKPKHIKRNNISKAHCHILSIFWTTPKTPKTQIDLTFKNYTEKPYTTFIEKVDLFTRNPTKLGLHFSDFSMFFNDFMKFLLIP